MSNLTEIYNKLCYKKVFNQISKVDIDEFYLSRNVNNMDIIELLKNINEVITYVSDELIQECKDDYCKRLITEMDELISNLLPIIEFIPRAHDEIEMDFQDYLDADSADQIENDRLEELMSYHREDINTLENKYRQLNKYLVDIFWEI